MYFNKTITPYQAKKDGYYLGNCVSKKSPPLSLKLLMYTGPKRMVT